MYKSPVTTITSVNKVKVGDAGGMKNAMASSKLHLLFIYIYTKYREACCVEMSA